MRQQTAIVSAYGAARRVGEPFLVRSNADRTWWWFERLSWLRKHPNFVPPHLFRYKVNPDGTKETLNV